MELEHSHIGWLVIFLMARTYHTYSSQNLSNINLDMFAFSHHCTSNIKVFFPQYLSEHMLAHRQILLQMLSQEDT